MTNTTIAPKQRTSAVVEEFFNDFPATFGTDFTQVRRALNRMFNSAVAASAPAFATDLYEKDGKYVFEVAAPGFAKEDLIVTCKGNTITVSGQRRAEKKSDDTNYHYHELQRGRLYRTLTLPVEFDERTIDAQFKDGMLTLTLTPLAVADAKKIEIKA